MRRLGPLYPQSTGAHAPRQRSAIVAGHTGRWTTPRATSAALPQQ